MPVIKVQPAPAGGPDVLPRDWQDVTVSVSFQVTARSLPVMPELDPTGMIPAAAPSQLEASVPGRLCGPASGWPGRARPGPGRQGHSRRATEPESDRARPVTVTGR